MHGDSVAGSRTPVNILLSAVFEELCFVYCSLEDIIHDYLIPPVRYGPNYEHVSSIDEPAACL